MLQNRSLLVSIVLKKNRPFLYKRIGSDKLFKVTALIGTSDKSDAITTKVSQCKKNGNSVL
jgi:hypothetical protein